MDDYNDPDFASTPRGQSDATAQLLPIESDDTESSSSDETESDSDRPWGIAFFLMLIPGLLLADLLHPAILNKHLFESVNNASSHHYKLLKSWDCVLAGVLIASILIAMTLAFKRKRMILMRLTALAYCFVIPLGLVEAYFQVTSIPRLYSPGMIRDTNPKPEIAPGITGRSRMTINRLGLRGPDPQDEPRKILCIGGSTTICSYLNDDETWPAHLMKKLNQGAASGNTCVQNAGKNGLDLLHHIEFLNRCQIADQFDDCIVLCGVNDLEHSIRMAQEDRIALAPSHIFDVGGPDYPLTPHFKQAILYKMLKNAVKRIIKHGESDTADPEGEFYTERRKARQKATKDYPLPPLDDHLAFYKKSLSTLKEFCDANGLHLVLVTQPVLWREDLPPDLERLLWSRPIGDTKRVLATESLSRGMKAFNDSLREFCAESKVDLVDLAAVLPQDETVFYDDEHFNENGAKLVADQIAKFFESQKDDKNMAPKPSNFSGS